MVNKYGPHPDPEKPWNQIVQAYLDGGEAANVGRQFDVCRKSVLRAVRRAGYEVRLPRRRQRDAILELHQAGATLKELAVRFDMKEDSVRWRIKHPSPPPRPCKTHYERTYGLTNNEHEELLALQDGRCAICGDRRRLYVDHDHQSGVVRGLLCPPCNTGIGHLKDSSTILQAAIDYLRRLKTNRPNAGRGHRPTGDKPLIFI